MASRYEKALGAEWLVALVIETADALVGVGTPKWSGGTKPAANPTGSGFKLPNPSQYFATMIVFLMLAAASMFGEKPGKLAAAFGGVTVLGIAMVPSKVTGKPVILSLTAYVGQLLTGGSQGQAADTGGTGDYVPPNLPLGHLGGQAEGPLFPPITSPF